MHNFLKKNCASWLEMMKLIWGTGTDKYHRTAGQRKGAWMHLKTLYNTVVMVVIIISCQKRKTENTGTGSSWQNPKVLSEQSHETLL